MCYRAIQNLPYFQNFVRICSQISVKIWTNPYTWRLCCSRRPAYVQDDKREQTVEPDPKDRRVWANKIPGMNKSSCY